MRLKYKGKDPHTGGLIFDDEKGKPVINVLLSSGLNEEQRKELIDYISKYTSYPVSECLECEIEEVNKIIQSIHTINKNYIVSHKRLPEYVQDRAILTYYMRKKMYPVMHIGKLIGKSHCTVIHLLKRYAPVNQSSYDYCIYKIDEHFNKC
jgi:hypothetical protein